MDEDVKPLIGIPCRGPDDPSGLLPLYSEAILAAGGRPEYLYPGNAPGPPVEHLDGLLIPGGRDITPQRYGDDLLYEINPEDEGRIVRDLSILGAVLKYNRPVFGICYGMQLINVCFGGRLYQDIRSQVSSRPDHSSGYHDISVAPGPHIPPGIWSVNSSHHQAVKDLGAGLLPAAFSPDGIMEAFYAKGDNYLVGVQWHPERLADEMSLALLRGFVSACIRL